MQNATLEKIYGVTPTWLPQQLIIYIAYTHYGLPMRQIARDLGIQPSTVSRTIKKVSNRLRDPLFCAGLKRIMATIPDGCQATMQFSDAAFRKNSTALKKFKKFLAEDQNQEGRKSHILQSSHSNHSFATSLNTDSLVVANGNNERSHAESKNLAYISSEPFLSEECFQLRSTNKTSSYDAIPDVRNDFSHRNAINEKQRNHWPNTSKGAVATKTALTVSVQAKLRMRALTTQKDKKDPPLIALARMREKTGKLFLSPELVRAGQLFREDYELSMLILSKKDSKDKIAELPARDTCTMQSNLLPPFDPACRLVDTLNILGPDLFDVAVHFCCFFKGLQNIEKNFGWSPRSGKIVLRIALIQLSNFYSEASKR